MNLGATQSWIELFSYPAVFLLLLGAGVGVPVSEEVVMITGGVVVGKSGGSLLFMMGTAWLGVLLGDFILFHLGRRLGPRAVNHRWLRLALTPGRVGWVTRHFHRFGALTIFIARFTLGFRVVTFLSAGISGVRASMFLLADAAAAAIYVPLLVWLGWRFGAVVMKDVESAFMWILLAIAVLGGVLWGAAQVRQRRRARRVVSEDELRQLEHLRELDESA